MARVPDIRLTSEEALRFKGLRFTHGRFAGRTMVEVSEHAPSYITWCWENTVKGMGIPPALYDLVCQKLKALKQTTTRPANSQARPMLAGHWDCRSVAVPVALPPEEPSFLDGVIENTALKGGFLDELF